MQPIFIYDCIGGEIALADSSAMLHRCVSRYVQSRKVSLSTANNYLAYYQSHNQTFHVYFGNAQVWMKCKISAYINFDDIPFATKLMTATTKWRIYRDQLRVLRNNVVFIFGSQGVTSYVITGIDLDKPHVMYLGSRIDIYYNTDESDKLIIYQHNKNEAPARMCYSLPENYIVDKVWPTSIRARRFHVLVKHRDGSKRKFFTLD